MTTFYEIIKNEALAKVRNLPFDRLRVNGLRLKLFSVHPETPFFSSPSTGEGRVRVILVQNIEMFCFAPPHPSPLPQGERGFPDENYLVFPFVVSLSNHKKILLQEPQILETYLSRAARDHRGRRGIYVQKPKGKGERLRNLF